MRQVLDRHLGATWLSRPDEWEFWEAIDRIDDGEIWETHQTLKAILIGFARRRAARHAEERGEPAELVAHIRQALSLDALTIGFARRFATYKRANLILRDIEAIASLVGDPASPQLIFASHIRDLTRQKSCRWPSGARAASRAKCGAAGL
jgi:starch phosphorylase